MLRLSYVMSLGPTQKVMMMRTGDVSQGWGICRAAEGLQVLQAMLFTNDAANPYKAVLVRASDFA